MLIMLKEHLKRHYPAKDLAKRYAISTSKWAKAGFPERSDEETRGILSICKSNECGKYRQVNDRGGWCASCGCNLTEGSAVLNKIRRSTESCPEGLW